MKTCFGTGRKMLWKLKGKKRGGKKVSISKINYKLHLKSEGKKVQSHFIVANHIALITSAALTPAASLALQLDAVHSVAPALNWRGIIRPFGLFPGLRSLRPSSGRPTVIVLLGKNFHLAAWHANSCMKHICGYQGTRRWAHAFFLLSKAAENNSNTLQLDPYTHYFLLDYFCSISQSQWHDCYHCKPMVLLMM